MLEVFCFVPYILLVDISIQRTVYHKRYKAIGYGQENVGVYDGTINFLAAVRPVNEIRYCWDN